MKRKILIVLPDDALNGAEQVLKQLSQYYSINGYKVDIFFLKRKRFNGWEDLNNNVQLFFTKANREKLGLLPLIANLIFKAARNSYEIAYTSHYNISALIGCLRRIGILSISKFVVRESTMIFQRFMGLKLAKFKIYYTIGYVKSDLVICQTEDMKSQLVKNMPVLSKKLKLIESISNPINCKELFAHNDKVVAESNDYLVAAGRLIYEKGFDILIRSFASLSFKYPHLNLIILGEGSKRQQLEQLIVELDLADRIILKGHAQDVYPYFRNAKACIVSSRIEGFPNVLLQMMSQNVRIISTLCSIDIGKIKGIFTCQPDDVCGLTEAIERSFAASMDLNKALFKNELEKRDIEHYVNKIHLLLGSGRNLPSF